MFFWDTVYNIRWSFLLKLAKASGRFLSLWLYGDAQWAHLVASALDAALTCGIHPERMVR